MFGIYNWIWVIPVSSWESSTMFLCSKILPFWTFINWRRDFESIWNNKWHNYLKRNRRETFWLNIIQKVSKMTMKGPSFKPGIINYKNKISWAFILIAEKRQGIHKSILVVWTKNNLMTLAVVIILIVISRAWPMWD